MQVIDLESQLKTAIQILDKLHIEGYQAFFVGGFVRDYLLDIPIQDIDIATSAKPEEVQRIFPDAIATGVRFGTVSIKRCNHLYEITTFRSETEYDDHRHPKAVTFAKDLEDDLKRRDFTINAIAMTKQMEIIDPLSGREDLKRGLIRAIGEPLERFTEDALRVLRAFRFVAKLGYDLEAKTSEGLKKAMPFLKKIANERIMGELGKIIVYPENFKALKLMHLHGLGDVIEDIGLGLQKIAEHGRFNLNVREFYAFCFYLAGCADIPKTWRFSNKEKVQIMKLIDLIEKRSKGPLSKLDIFRAGLDDSLASNKISKFIGEDLDQENQIHSLWRELPIKKESDLKYKATDLIDLMMVEDNRQIGEVFQEITDAVVCGRIANNEDEIKDYVLNRFREGTGKR